MTIGENIRQLRRKEGLSQEQLAEIAQVTNKAVSSWEIGGRTPRLGALRLIAAHFGISVSDLLTPDDTQSGPIPAQEAPAAAPRQPIASFSSYAPARAQPPREDALTARDQELLCASYINADASARTLVCRLLGIPTLSVHRPPSAQTPVEVIVYDSPAAAGLPLYVDSSFERLSFAPEQVPPGTDFGVRIFGDSMQPTIPSGHIAFVRKQSTLRSGEIGIFTVDGEAVCKRYHEPLRGHPRLVSDNPAYAPIDADSAEIRALGLVLGSGI